jgi:hypothetical protein
LTLNIAHLIGQTKIPAPDHLLAGSAPASFATLIDRCHDQPATNGGNWFAFNRTSRKLLYDGWQSIDTTMAGTT